MVEPEGIQKHTMHAVFPYVRLENLSFARGDIRTGTDLQEVRLGIRISCQAWAPGTSHSRRNDIFHGSILLSDENIVYLMAVEARLERTQKASEM